MVKIDVRIPFEPGGKLGADYNRIFRETKHEWVLLLDHDVLLLNPHWYWICQQAIAQNPKAGILTCWTNNIGNPAQRAETAPAPDAPIAEHRKFARTLFDAHGSNTTPINGEKCSGMFLLIRKAAWTRVGGFRGVGLFGEDWNFGAKVQRARMEVRRMDGLYVYHVRDRTDGSWITGVETSKEIRDKRMAGRREERQRERAARTKGAGHA